VNELAKAVTQTGKSMNRNDEQRGWIASKTSCAKNSI